MEPKLPLELKTPLSKRLLALAFGAFCSVYPSALFLWKLFSSPRGSTTGISVVISILVAITILGLGVGLPRIWRETGLTLRAEFETFTVQNLSDCRVLRWDEIHGFGAGSKSQHGRAGHWLTLWGRDGQVLAQWNRSGSPFTGGYAERSDKFETLVRSKLREMGRWPEGAEMGYRPNGAPDAVERNPSLPKPSLQIQTFTIGLAGPASYFFSL